MTSRSKKKSVPSNGPDKQATKRVESSWVLLAKESLLENSNFTIVTLPHPAHGTPTKYCLDDAHNRMYEVATFDEHHRSWFIGQTVKSDGSLLISTPINPVFLVLPRLKEQCCSRAIPLEDLLSEKGFDKIIDFVPSLDKVADMKGTPDMKAYKYNEEKTLHWLEEKVKSLAKVLREKHVHVRAGAVSATFVASNVDNDTVTEELYLKYAHGLISEYLQDDLIETLEKRFNFTPDMVESLSKKRKSDADENLNTSKKIKCDSVIDEGKENGFLSPNHNNESKKQKPLSAKEKARQKAASGTKTISSFFTKK